MEYGDRTEALEQFRKEFTKLDKWKRKDLHTMLVKYVKHRNSAVFASESKDRDIELLERGIAEHYQAQILSIVLEQNGYLTAVNGTCIHKDDLNGRILKV